MNWNRLTTDIQEVALPEKFTAVDRDSSETQNINDMLKDLNLVKDRRSKNINDVGDQIKDSPQEADAKTSFNNDEKDRNADKDEDSVCVQKPHLITMKKIETPIKMR